MIKVGVLGARGRMGSEVGRALAAADDLELAAEVDDVLAAIDAVTHDDIRAIAAEVLTRPKVLAVVGPFEDDAPFAKAVS